MSNEFKLIDREIFAHRNKFKERSTDYDYFGDALIDDKQHWCNIWVNKDKNGSDYLNIKLKPKEPVAKKAIDEINGKSKTNDEINDTSETNVEKYKEALIKKGIDDLNNDYSDYSKAQKYAAEQMADKLTEQQTTLDQFDDDIPF